MLVLLTRKHTLKLRWIFCDILPTHLLYRLIVYLCARNRSSSALLIRSTTIIIIYAKMVLLLQWSFSTRLIKSQWIVCISSFHNYKFDYCLHLPCVSQQRFQRELELVFCNFRKQCRSLVVVFVAVHNEMLHSLLHVAICAVLAVAVS